MLGYSVKRMIGNGVTVLISFFRGRGEGVFSLRGETLQQKLWLEFLVPQLARSFRGKK
jgi:hypothetical protein